MPLPKLPTRPAAILDLANIDASRQAHAPQVAVMQPALENFEEPAPPAEIEAPASRPHVAPVNLPARPPAGKRSARGTPPAPAGTAANTSASRSTKRAGSKPSADGTRKLFVLDTNVLLHDPSSLFRFEEHDVFLPMMTLEELDHQKKGMSEVARNARQVSRSLDSLVGDHRLFEDGLPLSSLGNKDASGKLFFQTSAIASMLPSDLPMGKADNQILGVVRALHERHPTREVVLVSKDINMRLKAYALGLAAEDYFNDQVLEDSDLLYSGV
ncbi:MAG: PhoH family protein, partial [Burkholderiaceae bacterium]|nr:PhoH family protein [Burkholderiaceae bacterium]